MGRCPPGFETAASESLHWIRLECDAAWASKLAILRVDRREDIFHFGTCLREHEMHAAELRQLLRAVDPDREAPQDPPFVARDAYVIGALDGAEAVIAAMHAIEASRIHCYDRRTGRGQDEPHRTLDALLARHAADARQRLAWLKDRQRARAVGRAVAA